MSLRRSFASGVVVALVITVFVSAQHISTAHPPTQGTSTPNPAYAIISPQNAQQIQKAATFGLLNAHGGGLADVVWHPDGGKLLTASYDKTAIVWGHDPLKMQAILRGHREEVFGVAWSADGKWLATGGRDFEIVLWDAATFKPLQRLIGHKSTPYRLAFSPDGSLLASGGFDGTVRFWGVPSGRFLYATMVEPGGIYDIAFNPDGTRLIGCNPQGVLHLWDARNGQQIQTIEHPALSVAWSSDGALIAAGAGDGSILLWDVGKGVKVRTLTGHTGAVNGLDFNPDGTLLASASADRTIKVWDVSTGSTQSTLAGHIDSVNQVVFNPLGTLLASAGRDGVLRLWDVSFSSSVAMSEGALIAFSLDAAGMPEHLSTSIFTLINTESLPAPDSVYQAACTENGARLAVSYVNTNHDSQPVIDLIDTSTGAITQLRGHGGPIYSLDWRSAGALRPLLASGSADGTIRLWDGLSGTLMRVLEKHTGLVTHAIWSGDGQRLVTASLDGTMLIWDTNFEVVHTIPIGLGISRLAVNFNGRFVAGALDNKINMWEVDTGERIRLPQMHTDDVSALAFNPEGTLLASADMAGDLFLWDTAFLNNRPIASLSNDFLLDSALTALGISGLRWLPDRLFVTGNNVITVWAVLPAP
jgi:WD40 repeat protein